MGMFHVHCEAQWQIGREWFFFSFFPHDAEDRKIIFNVVGYESTGYFPVTGFLSTCGLITGLLRLLFLLLEWCAAVMSQQWLREALLKSEHSLQRALTSTQEKASCFHRHKLITNKCPLTLLLGLRWVLKEMSLHLIMWRRTGAWSGAPWLNWKLIVNLEHVKNVGQKSHFLVKALNNIGWGVSEQPMFLKELHCLGFLNGLDI